MRAPARLANSYRYNQIVSVGSSTDMPSALCRGIMPIIRTNPLVFSDISEYQMLEGALNGFIFVCYRPP